MGPAGNTSFRHIENSRYLTTLIDRGNCLAPRIAMAKPKSRTGGSAGALPPGDALGGERVELPLESPRTP